MRMQSGVIAAAAIVALAVPTSHAGRSEAAAPSLTFSHPRTIDNRYLPLTAHRRCETRGRANDGTRERGVQTVLQRTRRFVIAGQPVDAAVIRDDAYEDGKLVESTLDYFAQADDGTVYYLGEDVRNIANGKVVHRSGSWLFGRDTDVPGVVMPANPQLGDQWRAEDVPGITTESDRLEETGMRAKVHGSLHTDVIRVSEFIQPEGSTEYKLYAPGIGVLVEYEPDARGAFAGCR
jgi:hypothetical protein